VRPTTLALAFVFSLALLLAGLIGFAAGVSVANPGSDTETGVGISGFNNNGNNLTFQPTAAPQLAKRAMESGVAPTLDEPMLRTIVDSLLAKAREGDVNAALFALELARLQRQAAEAATQPASSS
jgi:hypothetical protein